MYKSALLKLIILSAIAGAILALLSLIPVVVKLSIFVLMTCVSIPIILYLRYKGEIQKFSMQECMWQGALCGFISYLAFSLIFIPIVALISHFFSITYLGGTVLMLKLSNFWLILMFTLFISGVSVLFNAFSALALYFIGEIYDKKDN